MIGSFSIDEMIEFRAAARKDKQYQICDLLRDFLDTQLIFIFDGVNGQEVYYLTESYFKFKTKIEEQKKITLTNRKFVEYRIKQDINSEAYLQDWINRYKQKI
jgi:hypothetical protein